MLGQGPLERGWEKGSAIEGATQGADRGRASFSPFPLSPPVPPGSERLVGVSEFSVLVVTPARGWGKRVLCLGVNVSLRGGHRETQVETGEGKCQREPLPYCSSCHGMRLSWSVTDQERGVSECQERLIALHINPRLRKRE